MWWRLMDCAMLIAWQVWGTYRNIWEQIRSPLRDFYKHLWHQPFIQIFYRKAVKNQINTDHAIYCIQHVKATTKLPPFCRRHFLVHFHVWNCCILIKISLKVVTQVPTDNKTALVPITVWRRTAQTSIWWYLQPPTLTLNVRGPNQSGST